MLIQNQKIKIFLIIFLLTIKNTNLICSEGCLRCSAEDVCEICDINLNFVREEDTCIKQNLQNCLLSYEKNKCAHCNLNYYLNTTNYFCSEVIIKIPFCNFYLNEKICKECEQGYYIKENICVKVINEVEDCAEYIGDGKCKRCFEKVLSIDQTKCEKTDREMDFNCAYRFFPQMCHKCKLGYETKRRIDVVDLEILNQDFSVLRKMKFKSRLNYKNYPYCYESDNDYVSNPECSDKNFLKADCFQCDSGKYFDQKTDTCVTNPKGLTLTSLIIPHCSFINPDTIICEKCFEGFFIHYSKKKCLEHSKNIDGCVTMSQKIDGECYLCKEDYFLETSELCTKRTFIDTNCEHFSYFSDTCIECKTDFVLINNNEKCIPIITKCQNYTTGINSITCSKCLSNYYLTSNSCEQVPSEKLKSGCLSYNTDIHCIECDPTRILLHNTLTSDYTCPLIASNANFKLCNQAREDANGIKCFTCADHGIKLTHYNRCVSDSDLPANCEKYVNDGAIKCVQCIDGYYLNSLDDTCYEGQSNCRLYASNAGVLNQSNIKPQCLICEENYFLVDNLCIDESNDSGGNCHLMDSNSNCVLCKNNFHYSATVIEKEYEECRSKLYYPTFSDCGIIERTSDHLITHSEACIKCPYGKYSQHDDETVCHNCSDNNCAFYNTTAEDKLVVKQNPSDHCLIYKQGKCLQFRDQIHYYLTTDLSTPTTSYHIFRNKLIPSVPQYTAKGYKTNYSKYYKNIFFASTSAATANTISNITCKNGIARTFEKQGSLTPNVHDCLVYIKNCNINSDTFIGSEKRIYASCNKCYGDLAVHYTKTAILTSNASGLTGLTFGQSYQGNNLPSTFCYSNTTGTGAKANCGLFEVTYTGSTFARTCIDCKAGFKMAGGNCVEITNCKTSRVTGRCERCVDTKALKGFTECVNAAANCLEVNSSNTCIKCRDGFKILGGGCQKIDFYNCEKFEGDLCVKCKDPMEVVYKYKRNEISGTISCSSTGTTSKPPNCKLVDFKGYCVLCNTDYYADLGGKCYSKNNVLNCKLFNGLSGHCFECLDGFVYNDIQKKCISPNNLAHDSGTNALKTCSSDYSYPFKTNKGMTNSCGNVFLDNCTFLDYTHLETQKLGCLKCKKGYKLENHTVSNSLESCLIFEKLPNCKYHLTDKKLNYSCIECNTGYYLDHAHICRPRFTIPECIEYYINSKYCKRCSAEYYAQDNECKKRSKIYDYCVQYYLNSDDCKQFKSDYQYFYEIRDLVLNPPSVESSDIANAGLNGYVGISGCEEYYDFTTCRICGSNTYLKNNSCYPTNNIVPDCLFYKANSICQECNTGYLLTKNECKLILAQNCLVYTDETKCKTCPREYPVLTENFDCSKNNQVKFCEEHKTASTCSKCIAGYYLKSDQCLVIDKKIEKCIDYDSAQNCITCESGYYTWQNSCFINPDYDNNCEYFGDTKYNCSLCYEGYILIDNYCFKCGHIFENCAVCDEVNNDRCLMCKSGYYMNKDGTCNKNLENHAFIPFFVIDAE